MSKTHVAPIKRVTIPRLELNGTLILAQLLSHCKKVLDLPLNSVHTWTDSTIVLAWIQGNPRRFKVYMGNWVSQIMDLTPADCWNHLISEDNPADCASRGMFPSELLLHDLWWNGPSWLKLQPFMWPKDNSPIDQGNEELDTVTSTLAMIEEPLIPVDRFSSFTFYKQVTAWVIQFVENCKAMEIRKSHTMNGPLTISELCRASNYSQISLIRHSII